MWGSTSTGNLGFRIPAHQGLSLRHLVWWGCCLSSFPLPSQPWTTCKNDMCQMCHVWIPHHTFICLQDPSSLHFTDKIGQARYLGSSGSAKGPNFEASPGGCWWLAWSPNPFILLPFKGTQVPHIFTITIDEHPPTLCNTTISTTSAEYLTICIFLFVNCWVTA